MKIIKTYYLIDYENVGSEGFKGCENYGNRYYPSFIQITAENRP